MASPTIVNNNGGRNDALSTSGTVNLPATIVAGRTLLICIAHKIITANGFAFTGWTQFAEILQTAGSVASLTWFWKKATGTEGATAAGTWGSTRLAYVTLQIDTASDPTVTAPVAAAAGVATANTNAPNPPSITPAGGSKDFLFLASFASSAGRITTTAPTSYNSTRSEGSNSGTATNVGMGVADRALTAATEDPAAFLTTGGTTEEIAAHTVAIYPAAAAAPKSLAPQAMRKRREHALLRR